MTFLDGILLPLYCNEKHEIFILSQNFYKKRLALTLICVCVSVCVCVWGGGGGGGVGCNKLNNSETVKAVIVAFSSIC